MKKHELLLSDTNTVMYLIKGDKTVFRLLNRRPVAINFVTEIELRCWPNVTKELSVVIQDLVSSIHYFDYSTRIKEVTIELKRRYKLKLADAFIAATAIEYNLPLISADTSFAKVKDLSLVNFIPSV